MVSVEPAPKFYDDPAAVDLVSFKSAQFQDAIAWAKKMLKWGMFKNFQQIVCSPTGVRKAMDGYAPLAAWWKLILRLHGKPVEPCASEQERLEIVANGFRFYAHLYRLLAVMLLALAPTFVLCGVPAPGSAWYWCGACFLGGLFLWLASGLGYTGAHSYRATESAARAPLVIFMVLITIFLSMFLAALSIVTHHQLPVWLSLLAPCLLMVVGVGSYFIEIIYLVLFQSTDVS